MKLHALFDHIFFKLLYTRILIIKPVLIDKIVNLAIWTFCSLIVYGYIMQTGTSTSNFGIFSLAGVIATAGLFEVYGNVVAVVLDLESERSISYYLTLPTTPRFVLLAMVAGYTLVGLLLSCAMIPVGKILFFNSLNLSAICWPKLIVITILSNFFYALLVLSVAAHIKTIYRMGNCWSRFIFPMWFLGGFQFSWASMYALSKPFAYVVLLNPVIYIMEGTRAAILGQSGYIQWELCIGALIIFCVIGWYFSYKNMKKLLDFV
jgi:ABC-2 type transport system permease protein